MSGEGILKPVLNRDLTTMYTNDNWFVILLSRVNFSDWVTEIWHFSPIKTNNSAQLGTMHYILCHLKFCNICYLFAFLERAKEMLLISLEIKKNILLYLTNKVTLAYRFNILKSLLFLVSKFTSGSVVSLTQNCC